jgi:hypothetical protein
MIKKQTQRNRTTLIEERNRNSLTQLLTNKTLSIEEKQALVRERNEYLFIFGDNLTPQNGKSYQDFINHLYLGD